MNRISFKLLAALAIFLFVAVIPIAVLATNGDVSIVKITNSNSEQEYIIYVRGASNQKFKYAFTTNANPEEMDLSYINSISDNQGNYAAVLDADTYEKLSKENKTIFMWAKDESEKLILEKYQLDLSKSLTKENIENVELLTNKIPVKISEKQEDTTTIKNDNIDGIEQITKVGYVEILDDKTATYYYETVKLPGADQYNELNTLVKQVQNDYNGMDMYEKLQFILKFNETFDIVTSQADWQEVENMTIKQPDTSIEGNQYLVLLKKEEEQGKVTTDVQFLTAYDDETQKVETEEIITQETTKLPITYDNIALFVLLGVIVILIIVVLIRMKKLNKKDEQQK